MPRPQFDHLGTVIDRFDEELTVYPYAGEENDGGFTDIAFDEGRAVRGMVRPEAAMDFEIGATGRVDEASLYLLIRNEYDVEDHDRIIFENDEWRVTEQQVEYLNDFSLFRMIPDGRGASDDDTDSDADNPFEPVPEEDEI